MSIIITIIMSVIVMVRHAITLVIVLVVLLYIHFVVAETLQLEGEEGATAESFRRTLLEIDADVLEALERAKYEDSSTTTTQNSPSHSSGAPEGVWSEVVSWSPRLLHIHNVIWPEEREHLIAIGKRDMARSTVVGTSAPKSPFSLSLLLLLVVSCNYSSYCCDFPHLTRY